MSLHSTQSGGGGRQGRDAVISIEATAAAATELQAPDEGAGAQKIQKKADHEHWKRWRDCHQKKQELQTQDRCRSDHKADDGQEVVHER